MKAFSALPADFAEDAFWAKVDKTENCWLWAGCLSGPSGYGVFSHKGKNYRAHRAAWLLSGRSITDELVLDHLCRVRLCVNPDHLEAVTDRVNILRGVGITAQQAARDRCAKGHPLSGDNLVVPRRSDGRRERSCRTCRNERCRAWRSQPTTCSCGMTLLLGSLKGHQRRACPDRARSPR